MKQLAWLLLFLLPALTSQAQHCPFDGAHLIAIKVVNKQGKMINHFNTVFYLVEVDNPMADSCEQAAGLLKKKLQKTATFIADCDERYGSNGYSQQLKNRLAKASVFSNANMMVNLNQAENTCTLIGPSQTVYTNYIYRQRKFMIMYEADHKEHWVVVPNEQIYSLCKASHSLEKFKPVIVKL